MAQKDDPKHTPQEKPAAFEEPKMESSLPLLLALFAFMGIIILLGTFIG